MLNRDSWLNLAELEDGNFAIGFNGDLKNKVLLTRDEMGNLVNELIVFMKARNKNKRNSIDVNLSTECNTVFHNEIKALQVGDGLCLKRDDHGWLTIGIK